MTVGLIRRPFWVMNSMRNAVASVLRLVAVGLLLLGVVAVFDLVCILVAAVKVSEGRHYRYPMCLRLIN